jgi:osmotically-inducible protein OsmY
MTATVGRIASELTTAPKHVATEVVARLRQSGYSALRDISCDIRGEHARLLGRLPSHYLKQVAQAIVAGIDGVRSVTNLIEVIPPRDSRASGVRVQASPTATVAIFNRTRG